MASASPVPLPIPLPMPTPVLERLPSIWSVINDYLLKPADVLVKTVPEVGHLSPVILTFGSLFVALVTLNYPLFIFGASSAEAYLLYNTISGISGMASSTVGLRDKPIKGECRSFFQGLTPSRFEYFSSKGLLKEFPNTPLYFISFAAAYCIQSMFFFSKECSELGPSYSNRIYLSLLSTGMFIILYTIYLIANGCEGFFSLLVTIIIGLVVGYLICYQNYLLLGKSAVNLLFIPILGKRTDMDYVCVRTTSR
jgi:hypothetical protein